MSKPRPAEVVEAVFGKRGIGPAGYSAAQAWDCGSDDKLERTPTHSNVTRIHAGLPPGRAFTSSLPALSRWPA